MSEEEERESVVGVAFFPFPSPAAAISCLSSSVVNYHEASSKRGEKLSPQVICLCGRDRHVIRLLNLAHGNESCAGECAIRYVNSCERARRERCKRGNVFVALEGKRSTVLKWTKRSSNYRL